MKRMKAFWVGGVVVAAMMAMAVGASSASASTTKLCKIEPFPSGSPCPAVDVYPSGTSITIAGEFSLSGLTSCLMKYVFKTTSSSGSPLEAEVTPFSITSCSGGDTVTADGIPWFLKITVTGTGPNGTSKMVRSSGTPEFEVSNGSTCVYGANIPQKIIGGAVVETGSPVTLPRLAGGCAASTELTMGGTSTPSFWVTE